MGVFTVVPAVGGKSSGQQDLPFLIARSASLFRHLSQSQSFLICSNSRQQVRKLAEFQKSTSWLVAAQKNLT